MSCVNGYSFLSYNKIIKSLLEKLSEYAIRFPRSNNKLNIKFTRYLPILINNHGMNNVHELVHHHKLLHR